MGGPASIADADDALNYDVILEYVSYKYVVMYFDIFIEKKFS